MRPDPSSAASEVHLLDIGLQEYGDSILCRFGDVSVLIDGGHPGDQIGSEGHPSIPAQLSLLLDQPAPPYRVDLLMVTHAHQDHIGCLPTLVEEELIQADWALVADPGLGWGRAEGDQPMPPPDARSFAIVAALREEVRSLATDDRTLARFLADAASLESRYLGMLATLEDRGTRVVRFGRDTQATEELIGAFDAIGLRVLGPSDTQLLICAQAIADATRDALDRTTSVFERDEALDPVRAYREIVGSGTDAADASSRPGAAINLQSTVSMFEHGNAKVLLTGDMQFADPQRGDPGLEEELLALRERVAEAAPFELVKVGHHGSGNAFSRDVMEELGSSRYFGLCAGVESLSHPSREVLELLDEAEDVTWARTDRNGLSTFSFGASGTSLTVARGDVNDPEPNAPDESPGPPASLPQIQVMAGSGGPAALVRQAAPDDVNLELRFARTPSHLSVSFEFGGEVPSQVAKEDMVMTEGLAVAGGRQLPGLLFVTSGVALGSNIGVTETGRLLGSIREQGLDVLDDLPAGVDAAGAARRVRERLRKDGIVRGVVIIGGYDVVPARRLDVLPPVLRGRLGRTSDPDDFVVWNDDAYGDLDDDGQRPEVPVSRIPDGRLADLVLTAIQSGAPSRTTRKGVRNVKRPFAVPIFEALPGGEPLLVSQPQTYDGAPMVQLDADCVYLMLHGDFVDSSRFWGEETPNNLEALNVTNIPMLQAPRVVFTGCCWGALTVDLRAIRMMPGLRPTAKAPDVSMAMSFLKAGANAFVGCTGAHYSPTVDPYGYFGGPMHASFWNHLLAGLAPSQALLEAKKDFLRGFPHGQTTDLGQAIELKILHQYTCLGLGW